MGPHYMMALPRYQGPCDGVFAAPGAGTTFERAQAVMWARF